MAPISPFGLTLWLSAHGCYHTQAVVPDANWDQIKESGLTCEERRLRTTGGSRPQTRMWSARTAGRPAAARMSLRSRRCRRAAAARPEKAERHRPLLQGDYPFLERVDIVAVVVAMVNPRPALDLNRREATRAPLSGQLDGVSCTEAAAAAVRLLNLQRHLPQRASSYPPMRDTPPGSSHRRKPPSSSRCLGPRYWPAPARRRLGFWLSTRTGRFFLSRVRRARVRKRFVMFSWAWPMRVFARASTIEQTRQKGRRRINVRTPI